MGLGTTVRPEWESGVRWTSVWDDAKISEAHVRQRDISSEIAHLVVETEIASAQKSTAAITVAYGHGSRKVTAARDVELKAGVNHIDLPIDIAHPELWNPNGTAARRCTPFKRN